MFDLAPFVKQLRRLAWRERFEASFRQGAPHCRPCDLITQLDEIWEPKRGHIWMRRRLETHRKRKAAHDAFARLMASRSTRCKQIAFAT